LTECCCSTNTVSAVVTQPEHTRQSAKDACTTAVSELVEVKEDDSGCFGLIFSFTLESIVESLDGSGRGGDERGTDELSVVVVVNVIAVVVVVVVAARPRDRRARGRMVTPSEALEGDCKGTDDSPVKTGLTQADDGAK
jgi:hypothetical protein